MRRTHTVLRSGKVPRQGRARRRRLRRQEWAYRLEAAWNRAVQWLKETVTAGGWFLLGAIAIGLALGIPLGWPELVSASILALSLVLMALLFLVGGKTLIAKATLDGDRVIVGTPVSCSLNVENEGRRPTVPLIVSLPVGQTLVEVPVPFLKGGGSFSTSVEIPTKRRSIVTVGPLMTARSSPVGIFVRETTWPGTHRLFIYPHITRLPPTTSGLIRDLEGEPHSRIVSDDLSFHAIREYMPGDQRAHIHWKSTAKTGRLMVRQFEETVRSEMLVALSTRNSEYADEDEFELAVSVAGSFGVQGLKDGRELRFVAGIPRPQFAPVGLRAVSSLSTLTRMGLMDDLAGIQSSDNANHVTEVAEVAAENDRLVSVAVVVSGSQVSLDDLRRSSLSFGPDIATVAVVCDRHATPGLQHLGGLTVVTVALLDDLRHLMVRRAQK